VNVVHKHVQTVPRSQNAVLPPRSTSCEHLSEPQCEKMVTRGLRRGISSRQWNHAFETDPIEAVYGRYRLGALFGGSVDTAFR
jgi:hypothetical protein